MPMMKKNLSVNLEEEYFPQDEDDQDEDAAYLKETEGFIDPEDQDEWDGDDYIGLPEEDMTSEDEY